MVSHTIPICVCRISLRRTIKEPVIITATPAIDQTAFASAVSTCLALCPRQLPTAYLYDDLGSALFEAICQLPWYQLTRAEKGLLHHHANDIASATGALDEIIELGPGNGEKLSLLMPGFAGYHQPDIHLIDVSPAALSAAQQRLADFRDCAIHCHHATYEDGLTIIAQQPAKGRRLMMMLGSNIGNFAPAQRQDLLRGMAQALGTNDYLLLGLDLIKPVDQLQLAYNDPLGVTEAFNRNLLQRINHELGGNFQQDLFRYSVRWNAEQSRVESHLLSRQPHTVTIPGASLSFTLEANESLWTESSYKFALKDCSTMLADLGFATAGHWLDLDAQFALILARRQHKR